MQLYLNFILSEEKKKNHSNLKLLTENGTTKVNDHLYILHYSIANQTLSGEKSTALKYLNDFERKIVNVTESIMKAVGVPNASLKLSLCHPSVAHISSVVFVLRNYA